MSMMDLQGAIGGPPGGGPAAINVPPPDQGAGPGGPLDQGGPPPDQGGGSSMDFLDAAEEALHQYVQVEPDEVDRASAGQALQIILKLKAKDQQDRQQGNMPALARAIQSGPPAAGLGMGNAGPPGA